MSHINELKKKVNRKPLEISHKKLRFLCGLTVALALVPEAVAFALAAGLPPDVGLNSAWIISVPRKGGCSDDGWRLGGSMSYSEVHPFNIVRVLLRSH